MAGAVWACNKKAHDLMAKQRREVKTNLAIASRQRLSLLARNPLADVPAPNFGMIARAVFSKLFPKEEKAK